MIIIKLQKAKHSVSASYLISVIIVEVEPIHRNINLLRGKEGRKRRETDEQETTSGDTEGRKSYPSNLKVGRRLKYDVKNL